MNGIELEDFESEAYDEGEDFGESGDDTEAEYAEETSERARQRAARRRRIAADVARRQRERARMRARPSVTVRRGPTPRQAVTAIRNMDLDARAREASLRRDMAAYAHSAERAGYVTATGAAVDQFFASFPTAIPNDFLKAGLRFAPLLLLAPYKQGSGVREFVRDPRVVASAAFAGILAVQHMKVFHRAQEFTPSGPPMSAAANTVQLQALRVDNTTGAVVPVTVIWGDLTPSIAKVAKDGTVTRTGTATGHATFSAVADGVIKTVTIDCQ